MKRRFLALILALSFSLATALLNPINAYAVVPEEAIPMAHTHTGGGVYEDGCIDNGSNHLHRYIVRGTCTICGQYYESSFTVPESHVITSIYTGNNYHAGSLHYAQYKDICTWCGHTSYRWKSYSCPGNGHCILPQSYNPTE